MSKYFWVILDIGHYVAWEAVSRLHKGPPRSHLQPPPQGPQKERRPQHGLGRRRYANLRFVLELLESSKWPIPRLHRIRISRHRYLHGRSSQMLRLRQMPWRVNRDSLGDAGLHLHLPPASGRLCLCLRSGRLSGGRLLVHFAFALAVCCRRLHYRCRTACPPPIVGYVFPLLP